MASIYLNKTYRDWETNKRLGYGDRGKEWDKKEYNVTLNKMRSYERTKKEFKESTKKV